MLLILLLLLRYIIITSTDPLECKRPHIVFMVADDLGWNDVSFHGSKQIPTPNIDAIARDGITLNQYYVQQICAPSRGCLMTGKYAIKVGFQHGGIRNSSPWGLPLKEKILPQYFKELNYSTHAVGKWHLGFFKEEYLPTRRGFDTFFGYYTALEDYFSHESRMDGIEGLDLHENEQNVWTYNGTYGTDLFTSKAKRVIFEHNSSQNYIKFLRRSKAARILWNKYDRDPILAASCLSQACEDALEIKCGDPPLVSTCNALKETCLYDVITDPCEYYNIASFLPEVTEELQNAIDKYRAAAIAPENLSKDPEANPSFHGNVWVPWK